MEPLRTVPARATEDPIAAAITALREQEWGYEPQRDQLADIAAKNPWISGLRFERHVEFLADEWVAHHRLGHYDPRRSLDVACPRCKVPRGKRCITRAGAVRKYPHQARRMAARAAGASFGQ